MNEEKMLLAVVGLFLIIGIGHLLVLTGILITLWLR
jgi:hypothetical protein